MNKFIAFYLRGLVYGIAFFIIIAIFFGFIGFVTTHPVIGIPILVLVIMPLLFGTLGADS